MSCYVSQIIFKDIKGDTIQFMGRSDHPQSAQYVFVNLRNVSKPRNQRTTAAVCVCVMKRKA